jgi:hypothetical protein
MLEQNLFSIAFFSQVVLVSLFIPSRILRRMTYVFETYPPSTHPLLYPKPFEHYEKKQQRYRLANLTIAGIGVAALAVSMLEPRGREVMNGMAFLFFMIQISPLLWIEASVRKELKLMRSVNPRTTRTAELNPRKLFDVLTPALFWTTVLIYVAFWVFIAWFRQFDYPWFGGFQNNLIITGLNVFFASILLWYMYGKKLNPHQSEDDRMRITRSIGTVMCLVSIAVTLYAVVTIYLSAEDARAFQPFARSVYFQVIILLSVQTYRVDLLDFDVYRGEAQAICE